MEITETSQLMRTQDNRATQYPLFVVQEYKEVGQPDGCGDRTIYVNGEDTLTAEEYDWACEAGDDEDNEWFRSDIDEYRAVSVSDEWVISDMAGFFFTEKACHDHIAQNKHHYNQPRSYVISAWRNYEMQEVMRAILKIMGEDIPDWYM